MSRNIAFQGVHGSFAEAAAKAFSKGESRLIACLSFEDLQNALDTWQADFAVVPVENTLIGKIESAVEFLETVEWKKQSECTIKISHNLIGNQKSALETLQTVESHPAALAQCENFFKRYSNLQKISTRNTAESAKNVVQSGDVSRAAIASVDAANLYNGKILMRDIQDKTENYTTFWLMSKNG